MLVSCSIVTFSQDKDSYSKGDINRDTLITKDNINKILKYLGIDPKTAKVVKGSSNYTSSVTVGQIEDAINMLNQQPKEITINSDNIGGVSATEAISDISNKTVVQSDMKLQGNVNLSYRFSNGTSYALVHSCTGTYLKTSTSKIWWDAANPCVTIDCWDAFTKYKIEKQNSLELSYTSSTITETSNLNIGGYVVIGIPGTPLSYDWKQSESTIITTVNWGTSYIP
ncbi:MAG: hypothetical protein N3I35_11560 [Clostridia bacterium]|nr:hypothetical protein [Clostridia bacterium]